jgi:hypothetical protein
MKSPNHASLLRLSLLAGLVVAPAIAFAQADGRPGNPPSTAVGRAVDRATGTPTVPDGAPGNPPGTAVGRAVDRATGTPTSADGRGNNPPGTVLDRAAERGTAAMHNATMTSTVSAAPGSALAARPRMTQILKSNVYNDHDEKVGEVEDVLLLPPVSAASSDAHGPLAVLQVGGFLGMGGRLVTVPLGDLTWDQKKEHLVLVGATKQMLEGRPAFDYASLNH